MTPLSAINKTSDGLNISIHKDREAVGKASASHVISILESILATQTSARVIFACAPSQNEFLATLVRDSKNRIDWSRVNGFHMDEYIGLAAAHPASFRSYLQNHFLSQVTLGSFSSIQGEAPDPAQECARIAGLIEAEPIDLICLGIGENGHLAFNDPPVADFADSHSAKIVELDQACREQQVHDGCFPTLDEVPKLAITLTIPVFLRAKHLSVVVPGERKARAVAGTCLGPITTQCPSSILRNRHNVTLFLDTAAAAGLSEN